ncbi:ferritin [Saccharopolyspora erythraea NRRL 2338]|uniref:Ferritin family protein n=2 Tax=Saccharopolyspora erythraea TaxID=1836 RepID=A4FJL2_SACEN|nr:ferritin [Saccharopolyspora erythraea]EQD82650.1 bacterioferritin [Saccharopolyspora erythraea D]PFG97886.1 ferritin [Saccharopolyspora erythraea NRRL 2338]QRK88024.1 ferritin [Saccharopolyspora erythraea]CAM04237.1 ferritin family protein [Saccharopolyspora erythraea NRRL 2338]
MTSVVKRIEPRTSRAQNLLEDQVGNEFTSSQQYLAMAVWFDQRDLPRLAAYFYSRASAKRDHAMKIVRYMMDNNIAVEIPAVPTVRNDFGDPRELVALAVEHEAEVTGEFTTLSQTAREEGDYLAEQFLLWFLHEQVEAASRMSSLLNVIDRSQGNMFDVETFLAREDLARS